MITAILNGSIERSTFYSDSIFNLSIPRELEGVDSNVLDPRSSWENKEQYDKSARDLARKFIDNFSTYGSEISDLISSGPKLTNKE